MLLRPSYDCHKQPEPNLRIILPHILAAGVQKKRLDGIFLWLRVVRQRDSARCKVLELLRSLHCHVCRILQTVLVLVPGKSASKAHNAEENGEPDGRCL